MYGKMKVLAVMMRKGGVGKTLLAVLLSQYFGFRANESRRVLLMDMDTQQNASSSLLKMEVDPKLSRSFIPPVHPEFDPTDPGNGPWDGRSSTSDLFYGREVVPYPTGFENLDVLPASEGLQDVELVTKEQMREKIYGQLKKFFSGPEVQELYDLIIIDTSPGEGAINRSILQACTHALLPVTLEEKPIQGLHHMVKLIADENRRRETAINVVGIVPNMVDGRYNDHKERLQSLRDDPTLSRFLAPIVVGRRADFPKIDTPNMRPDTVWGFGGNNAAREDAERFCKFVEEKLYGRA
jgi:chromosome partitioning protein